jgi:hypothetical protein
MDMSGGIVIGTALTIRGRYAIRLWGENLLVSK